MAADSSDRAAATIVDADGRAALSLTAGATEFTVVPGAGLLGTSLRVDGREFLSLHGGVDAALAGHTTGMPLLAPWANRLSDTWRVGRQAVDLHGHDLHRDATGLALHGTMIGRSGWEVVSVRTRPGAAVASFRFDVAACEPVMASFPFPHELLVGFGVTPGRLVVTTTLVATGRRAVPVSFGWHPYFVVPGARRDRMTLRLPARRRLVVDERRLPTGEEVVEPAGRVRLDRSFDDGFRLGRDRHLTLSAGRRRLSVILDRNYPYAQVYTPPDSESVALEPMTAATDALARGTTPMVAPGERFTARFSVLPT